MNRYPTRTALERAWRESATIRTLPFDTPRADAEELTRIMVKGKAVYVPHLYRGGWVIRDFGYSTDRIAAGYVSEDKAGDPEAV